MIGRHAKEELALVRRVARPVKFRKIGDRFADMSCESASLC
jgi:hypothetical protein